MHATSKEHLTRQETPIELKLLRQYTIMVAGMKSGHLQSTHIHSKALTHRDFDLSLWEFKLANQRAIFQLI